MKKQMIERACRMAGLTPARREVINGVGVCIADGFSAQPHITFRRFGAAPGEFPYGAYLTLWWLEKGEDEFEIGVPLLFEAFHNTEYDVDTKRLARINTALKEASGFMKRRQKVARELK
jgi:hypothetical protein